MKQSLKTVTTQLLNVSEPNESGKKIGELKSNGSLKSDQKKLMTASRIEKLETAGNGKEKSKIVDDKDLLIKEINSEISSLETMGVSFGRPLNSKFGYFETSHPGEAMAITDEELEKELSSKHDRLPYGTQPTTTGGISTWILLNSPTTTTTPRSTEKEAQRKPGAMNKLTTKPNALIEKVKIGQKIEPNPTATVERVTPSLLPGKTSSSNSGKPVLVNLRNSPKITTTSIPAQTHQTSTKKVDSTTPKTATTHLEKQSPSTTERSASTPGKKIIPQQKFSVSGTTVRPTTKITKVNLNRGKYPSRTTTTTSRSVEKVEKAPTPVVERVTFKPMQMVTTLRSETKTDKPAIFIEKETSAVSVGTAKVTPAPPARSTTPRLRTSTTLATRTDFTGSDLIEVPVQTKPPITRVNVLKAQMKKPVEEVQKVGVQPSKVSAAPISEGVKAGEKIDDSSVSEALDNSQIDLQFDFNPELTKIVTENITEPPSDTTTTKKPRRSSQKRRKNKNKTRRRRPSNGTTTTESNEIIAEPVAAETAIQESKIEPETKDGAVTKTKKKPVPKPLGTQIYNYLSREIMPSFGVVSLVGLGLGIASYFFYPFGGGIARRNYEVEPNYKYNIGEYGGNYGQNEEEVFSKVLQGMTNHEGKYGGLKEYDQNSYYRYQKFGSPTFPDPKLSRKSDNRYSAGSVSGPSYKPLENTYDLKYRNTEFKYPEVATTPNYFERQKQSGYTVSGDVADDRQFVVGSVPKEYGYDESLVVGQKAPTYQVGNAESQTDFDRSNDGASYVFPKTSANVPLLQSQSYGQPEALPLKSDDSYDDIEITPTAVAVEHGPRALKVKRSVEAESAPRFASRFRRESVIQVIPPTGSLEVDEKEEDLSNEIFDILDLMIPGKDQEARKIKEDKGSNAIDSGEKIAKKKEESTTQKSAEVTVTNFVFTTEKTPEISSATSSSSSSTSEATSVTPALVNEETTTVSQPKDEDVSIDENVTETEGQDLEETTLEWNDSSTTEEPAKEEEQGFNIFTFVKKVAEVKFRLGLTILKHASEGFARYLGGVQKRINGEE